MKPFFSPLVKEKVRLYFVNNKELTPTRVYVEKYLSLLSKYQDIKATDCTEEITYLLTSIMDEVVKIQQYTTLNRSHVLSMFYWIKNRMHEAIRYTREVQDDDEQYLCIVFDMAGEAFAKLFPGVSFMVSGTVSFQNKMNIYYLYQNYKDRLCNELYELREVVDYLLIMHYELSDSEIMTQFLAEEAIIKEQEAQKKENNVVSWEALMDNLQMVDKEHLDAFHSYFSKIATKYTQDNEKLRSNLDKLTQQIEECKKKYVPTIHKTINIDKVEQMVDCIEHQEIHKH